MISKLRTAKALCLAVILTFVPAILCAVTVASGYGLYQEYKEWQRKRGGTVESATHEVLVVDNEGRAAVAVRDSRGRPLRHLDARRSPINAVSENVRWLEGCWLFHAPQQSLPLWKLREYPIESLDGAVKEEKWFLVRNNQSDQVVFEGYDALTHRRIGFIGVDGFDEGPRDESKGFPVSGQITWGRNPVLIMPDSFTYGYHEYERARVIFDGHNPLRAGQWVLQSDERLFLVDSLARSVTELLPGMQIRTIAAASRVVPAALDPALPAAGGAARNLEYQTWLAVRTSDRVVLLNASDGRREEYVLPPDWNDRDFQLYLTSDGTAVLTSQADTGRWREVRLGTREYDVDVVSISPTGTFSRQDRFALHVSYHPSQSSERIRYWLPTVAVPGPLPSAVVAAVILPWFDSRIHQTRFADRAAVSLGETWPLLALVTLLAIGLAWLSDRHLRAFREPRSYVWLTFVFLMGLPGYVAWYCHRRWPVRRPAPPPEKTGAEIIA